MPRGGTRPGAGRPRKPAPAPSYHSRPLPPARSRSAADADPHARGRDIALRLLDELDATTSHLGELEAEIIGATCEDESGRRQAAMLKAISLPSRAHTLKMIVQSLNVLSGGAAKRPGKKETADRLAETAGAGTIWEKLLN
jgi:hypothetical protein